MTARAIMIQGTGSSAGKSLICTGLCRAFANAGLTVAPFKPQNMSNNAAVTADGGEIGRAQALQAMAARRAPVSDMNPVLLKPESERGAQVIVQGKRRETLSAREYFRRRPEFLTAVTESFARLCRDADLVIVEGAGSPAEVNLREGDIANMGFAAAVDIPALLVGNIHRGGVIASIVGTLSVIDPEDASRLKGFLVNNFHGDPELFSEGRRFLERRAGIPCLGVVPHFPGASRLPAEDAMALDDPGGAGTGGLRIAVPRLSRMANFDDLDPLRLEPEVSLHIIQPGEPLPGDADLVILPGSKSTIADLAFFREQGWDIDLKAHVRRGGAVLGICGGYQMLGRRIHDPQGLEGPAGSVEGLGLLDVETVLLAEKTTRRTIATHSLTGTPLKAYEIHLGRTEGPDCERPFATVRDRPEGARSPDGRIQGTYLHGAFESDAFRRAFLASMGVRAFGPSHAARVEETIDALARHLESHVDLHRILDIAMEPNLP